MKVSKFSSLILNSATALISSSILTASVLALTAPAKAATFTCPSNIAAKVTGTVACERSDTATQDFLNSDPATVNVEKFFNSTDWIFGGKIGKNTGYNGVGEGQSGTWNISSVFQNTWDDVMLIFKSGNGTFLTGYLLEDGVTSGAWTSPFLVTNDKNKVQIKDVSHISVYYKTGRDGGNAPTSVPEPSTMIALAIAGTGIVTYRRRKSSANS